MTERRQFCKLNVILEEEGILAMIIKVTGVEENMHQTLQHIANLYYEESTIIIGETDQWDLFIHIIQADKQTAYYTEGQLQDKKDGTKKADFWKETFSGESDKDRKKKAKQAVSHIMVKLLSEYTGTVQPWGTLTGIRPTKLYHKLIREGWTTTQIHSYLKTDYLLSDEKLDLLAEIVERQHSVLPDLYELDRGVSIYIGIPFCPTKCAYCTFPAYAINGRNGSVETFLEGLHYEMEQTGKWLKEHNIPVTTVYFGGGTPTSISAEEMDKLYSHMYKVFSGMEKVREVTVEAGRPDTITPEKIEVLKKWNIDRISINPQSFEDTTLKAIGRHHSVEETVTKYKLARDMGLQNINMDLIIGLPGEGVSEMEYSLQETEKLKPESLTVHTLSFKRASAMTKQKNKYKVAGRKEIGQMMDMTSKWTKENEYVPYYLYRQKNILGNLENVGYSFRGKESLYNIIIMEEVQTIIGLGCGAASKWVEPGTGKITRFANPKDPVSYNNGYEDYTNKKIKQLEELFQINDSAASTK